MAKEITELFAELTLVAIKGTSPELSVQNHGELRAAVDELHERANNTFDVFDAVPIHIVDTSKAPGSAIANFLISVSHDAIFITDQALNVFNTGELTALVAHEYGHLHYEKIGIKPSLNTIEEECYADRYAGVLGYGQALMSAIKTAEENGFGSAGTHPLHANRIRGLRESDGLGPFAQQDFENMEHIDASCNLLTP